MTSYLGFVIYETPNTSSMFFETIPLCNVKYSTCILLRFIKASIKVYTNVSDPPSALR